MKDTFYPVAGTGGSMLGMILGIIDVHGLFNAFLFGAAGALGGVLIKYLSKHIFEKINNTKNNKHGRKT